MAVAGPKVQLPSPNAPITLDKGGVTFEWIALFAALQSLAFNASRSGPTVDRPTASMRVRWIGMPYYDTTLGLPVFLHSVDPDVWHNGAGAVV